MSLSTKLLLRVTIPVLALILGLLALVHLEWTGRVLNTARTDMTRSASYASEIVDEHVDMLQEGLDSLLNSHGLGQWAIVENETARAEALLNVERLSRELVDRIDELRVVALVDADGTVFSTVGESGDIPWNESSTLQDEAFLNELDGVIRWEGGRWASIPRGTFFVGRGSIRAVGLMDLERVVVDALAFTTRVHPGACLVLASDDGQHIVDPGARCLHTDEQVSVSEPVTLLGGVVSLHDASESLLAGMKGVELRISQIGLGSLVVLVLLTWLSLRVTVVRPLHNILTAVEAFDSGRSIPPRATNSSDELGLLDSSMRNALHGLTHSQSRLGELNNTLEARVQERTQQLGLYAEELRAARDEAQSASAARSEFVSRLSHALRTPLNGIIGMTGLLTETELSTEQSECVEAVSRSGNSLRTLLDDVIHFSRLERNQVELDEQDFRVRNLLREVTDLVRKDASDKGLLLDIEVHPDLADVVRADVERIRQVLTHLVRNAVAFTDWGDVILRARPELQPTGNMAVRFEVHDTGVGVGPEARKHLFTPFSHSTDSARNADGQGLGLALCSLLVRAMDGDIGVNSQVGRGSTFWFTARCASVTAATTETEPETAPPIAAPTNDILARPSGGRGQRVLVVEDDLINQKVAARTLEKLGYQVDVSANGREALNAVQRAHYRAILMDCEMPVMDGFEATAAIRARPNSGEPIPIIAMTAHALDGDRERVLAAGMDDYLSKPVSRDDLSRMLQRWIPAESAEAPLEAS